MSHKAIFSTLFLAISFMLSIRSATAQETILANFDIGGALTHEVMNYDSYGDFLNDNLSGDYGYKLHLHYNHPLSEKVTILTGLEYHYFTFSFGERRQIETNEDGNPTGGYFITSMKDGFSTSHLLVPLRAKYHPLPEYRAYITAGAEFSYKIAFDNGIIETVQYDEDDNPQTESLLVEEYSIPESANDVMVNGTVGLGYNLGRFIPITAEVRYTQSITPYLSNSRDINSYLQGFSFSISYRL